MEIREWDKRPSLLHSRLDLDGTQQAHACALAILHSLFPIPVSK